MPAGAAEFADLLIRSLAMAVLFSLLFLLPGRTLAERLLPGRPTSERNALAWALGPWAVGALAWTLGGLTGWFLTLPLVGATGLLLALATPKELRAVARQLRRARGRLYRGAGFDGEKPARPDEAEGTEETGFPLLLAVAILGYFLLKFDSMYFHTLGTNAGVMHAVGIPLGITSPLLTENESLSLVLRQPLGQVAPAAALAGAFAYPGLRLWFAGTLLALALVTRALLRRSGLGPGGASFGAAVAAFNPWTMSMNQVDGLENLLPALWLGALLLISGGRSDDDSPPSSSTLVAVGLAAGILVTTRAVAVLGVPVLALLLVRRSRRAWLPFLAGAAVPLLWVLLHRLLSDTALLSDPGLVPLSPSAAEGSWWWWSGLLLRRMPYAAFPSWALLPLAWMQHWGSAIAALSALGAALAWRKRAPWLLTTLAAAGLPTLAVLLHGAVLQGRQFSRGGVWIVPTILGAAIGLRWARERLSARDWKPLSALAAAIVAVPLVGLALARVELPVEDRAYASFPHLQPEPEPWAATERARAAGLPPWPAYTPDFVIDPLIVGQGKRWRDLAFELRSPAWEDRYISLDEKLLSFHKGARFTNRWLPAHARRRPDAQPPGPGDPYGEGFPMTVAVDLRTALDKEVFWVDCRRHARDDVVLDLASQPGPIRLDVRTGPGREPVALHLYKEYYGPSEVEIALVVMPPEWSEAPRTGEAHLLADGVLRLLVPARAFFSYAQVLGEGHDTMELLVGLEWHAALRCEEGPGVFGPFRL